MVPVNGNWVKGCIRARHKTNIFQHDRYNSNSKNNYSHNCQPRVGITTYTHTLYIHTYIYSHNPLISTSTCALLHCCTNYWIYLLELEDSSDGRGRWQTRTAHRIRSSGGGLLYPLNVVKSTHHIKSTRDHPGQSPS